MQFDNINKLSCCYYLEVVKSFVDELKQSNSGNYKKDALYKWLSGKDFITETLILLFHYVYDYDKQYYVSSSNIKKHLNDEVDFSQYKEENPFYTLWNLLDDLSSRKYTGNEAIYKCIAFMNVHEEPYKGLILDVIDKDLKIGVSETTINKIKPNLIKVYNVALANKYDSKKHKLDNNWIIEKKCDGCRCNVIKKDGIVKCYSRQGKEFTTLNNLINELKDKMPDNTVFDGEICIVDKNGNESFQDIMKLIKRKDYTIENPMLLCFDMLTLEEFENGKGTTKYTDRVTKLKDWYKQYKVLKTMSILNYERFSQETLKNWEDKVKEYNWEGLMFRKDIGYENGRTNNLLKYKKFQDAEYIVKGVEKGVIQEIINGVATKIEAVGSLIIEHKGNQVNVGTGLSLEQRKRWFEHPEEIIGKQITVKFFEEMQDQNGNWSLRFPVLKYIYNEKRDI